MFIRVFARVISQLFCKFLIYFLDGFKKRRRNYLLTAVTNIFVHRKKPGPYCINKYIYNCIRDQHQQMYNKGSFVVPGTIKHIGAVVKTCLITRVQKIEEECQFNTLNIKSDSLLHVPPNTVTETG